VLSVKVVPKQRHGSHPAIRLLLLFLLAVGVLLAYRWQTARVLPPVSIKIEQSSSQDWAHILIPQNNCRLINNVWNKAAAGNGFEQQIFSGILDGKSMYGWRWRAPWHLTTRVVSQPQLVCGDKPWDEPLHLNPEFPFRAGSKKPSVNYNARLDAKGTYNMAFSLWVVSSLPSSRNGITHEIMIWNANGGQHPGGTKRDVIVVDGIPYDIYVEENHVDNSGQNGNHWTYVAFVAAQPLLSGHLDLGSFIDYLLQRGILTSNHYVTSLEFGNEVSEGSGIVEIRDFSLSLN